MITRETKLPRDYEVMDTVLGRGDAGELARLLTGLFPGSIWVGVTAENQEMADERIPALMAAVPVAVRFVSVEPMLEPVKLPMIDRLDWVICGAETGPGARPMKIEWAVDLYKQCQAAGVPFFFKKPTFNDQWSGLHDQVHGVRELPHMAREQYQKRIGG